MKAKVKATELLEPNVSRVAIVKRGANMLPFRITKGDNGMLDLTKIGAAFSVQKADTKPAVFAAVVRKEADIPAITERLKKAGIDVSDKSEKDGFVVFTQKNVPDTDIGLIKLDGDVGLLVSDISKAFYGYSFEGTSFEETLKTSGFYPSLRMAGEALNDTVYGIMAKAEAPTDAATAIAKCVDEFKAYVTTLAANIPVQAFKADMDRPAPVKKTDDPKVEVKEPGTPPPVQTKKEDANAPAAATGDPAPAATVPAPAGAGNDLLDGLKAIVEGAITGLRKEVTDLGTDIRKDVNAINLRVGQVADQVKKTEEAVHGTVTADPTTDKTGIKKTESNVRRLPLPPLLDTGTMDLKKEEETYEGNLKKAFGG
jgi:hypothetical protein